MQTMTVRPGATRHLPGSGAACIGSLEHLQQTVALATQREGHRPPTRRVTDTIPSGSFDNAHRN
jgi:hypothetical protein